MAGAAQELSQGVRILLVNDDEDDYQVTRGIVRQIPSFRSELRWEKTHESALAALRRGKSDVCLLDHRLGGRIGLELLTAARRSGCNVPIIYLRGTGDRQTDDLAMKSGADDYLEKAQLTATLLERSVRYALERARHMEELRKSQERYRHIVETMNQGAWVVDAQSRTTFMNARMASMLGYDRDDVAGASILDFVDDEWRDAARRDIARSREGAVRTECKLKHKDGLGFWVLLETTALFGEDGSYEGLFAMVTDVTDRRKSEKALRVSQGRLRRLWDSDLFGITISDTDGNIRDINEAGATMLGYSRDELLSGTMRWPEITAPECGAADQEALAQLRARGVASPWEKDLIRKDGGRVSILAGAAMLDSSEDIAIAIDVTDRKRAQQARGGLEEQLRQSQKMEAVGCLAGGVAHDFNNILSVILSYSDLVLGDLKDGDPIREDVGQIRSAGVRAADLTRQLLMFSRQQVIAPRVMNLNAVLSGMDKMLRRIVGEDMELTSISGESLGRVRIDQGSFEQVVMNLVINARDAMPTGGQITMETANAVLDEEYGRSHLGAKPGSYVMLSVSDTGTGMDKATLARIFEPFFTTKQAGKGTGLGLSTVFGIVHQSSGNIWVHSEPGVGTTFKIYLPRVDATAEERRPSLPPTTLRGSETILLVEDEEQVRQVARGILQRHGYSIIEAGNGEEALVLCERHPGTIQLLLTDVVMAHMSGPKLAQRLVRLRPAMKVLCMSGYTDDAAVRHGVIAAKLAYLQKPITVENLTRKVRQVLDSRPQV